MLCWILIGLGLRNLSMAPRQIPLVKSIIRSTTIVEAERLLAQALTLATETEIEDLVYGTMAKRFPLELTDGEESRPVA
jgi:phosphoenolpyruvate-protein kinase (PTS system EI component)